MIGGVSYLVSFFRDLFWLLKKERIQKLFLSPFGEDEDPLDEGGWEVTVSFASAH